MKYTIKVEGKDFEIIVETESIADIEEAHKKVDNEIAWLLATKEKYEPYES